MERNATELREVFNNGEAMSHFDKLRLFNALAQGNTFTAKERAHLDILVAHGMITLPEVN